MMNTQKELEALLQLIDDPDQEVFEAVSNRILSYGLSVLDKLENLWETSPDSVLQERIENIVHRLHYNNLVTDFADWSRSAHHELLPGALLVAKFLYPELKTAQVIHDIERLKRNIWLELNNYLTPLEQVTVFNSILYRYFGLTGDYNTPERPNDFLISKIIESKKGNQTGIGVLYLVLSELLDLPIKLIALPKQFALAYCKPFTFKTTEDPLQQIEFFIDPVTGQAFSHTDLQNYLNRITVTPLPQYFTPCNNKQVIQRLVMDFAQCYAQPGDGKPSMYQELLELAKLLE